MRELGGKGVWVGIVCLKHRDILARVHSEGAMGEHALRELAHHRLGLDVQVP
jgi:hypothetical protein